MEVDIHVGSYVAGVVDDCSLDKITAVSRFDSGERHAVYKVSYVDARGATNDVVVRVSLGNDVNECALAEREARVLEKVQGIAAPRVYDFRRQSSWFDAPAMCMQFLPGEQRDLSEAAQAELDRLGSLLASVHGLPVEGLVDLFPRVRPETYREDRVGSMLSKLPMLRTLPTQVHQRMQRATSLVTESLRSGESLDRLVLLHGDPAGGNIIWGPEPVLIDWEYARLGDPADEVAYVFGQHDLTPQQREAFWRGYGRRADVVERAAWWEPVTLYGSAMWWLDRWSCRAAADDAGVSDPSAPKPQAFYLENAIHRLDRFDRLSGS
jgi:aminoglycoside phosphotransferase (APT) family kinase protein